MGKKGIFLVTLLVEFVLSNLVTIPIIYFTGMFKNDAGAFTIFNYLRWEIFWFVSFVFFGNILVSHKYATGKGQELVFIISSIAAVSEILGFLVFAILDCNFEFAIIDWFGCMDKIMISVKFYIIFAVIGVIIFAIYAVINNKGLRGIFQRSGIRTNGKLNQVENSNLENSRWMNEQEKRKIFKVYKYSELGNIKKDGIPVMGEMDKKNKDMDVAFNNPCHSIIIGSTGSGKTTTFVSPMIQLLAATNAGSSMIITDPKGELFSMHSQFLVDRGYDVKVVDLRDTYSSYRWNPLDTIWDMYEGYTNAHKKAFKRNDDVTKSGLTLTDPADTFKQGEDWYEFEGKAYNDYNKLVTMVKLYKKKIFDEVYEDLNDLVSVLVPVENDKDPMWEKGARTIILAVLLAMLEDSGNPKLEMTKAKFNFFNMTKILQNSNNDYEDLRNYFKGRSPLSKALSLSKQVCDAAPTTRASYMSIVYEKLTLFNDAGICALTSSSDFSAVGLSERPTALFLKIPDEKDTRHNLAAIFILNIYKTLIKVASARDDLSLPRNVYFIMDEFGNMPKIEKFDKFITVGRSRKIWFTMIIQSYAQLNNVYGETVADIVKGNCGIKMFIGSNDMGTCKEYSELCGNITVATTSTSSSGNGDTNYSTQMQVRPLIYPSELQRLNHPGDIGHSIIVTFGNYPFKTHFTPQFKVPLYKIAKMDQGELTERFFNENEVFYNIKVRNKLVLEKGSEPPAKKGGLEAASEVNENEGDSQTLLDNAQAAGGAGIVGMMTEGNVPEEAQGGEEMAQGGGAETTQEETQGGAETEENGSDTEQGGGGMVADTPPQEQPLGKDEEMMLLEFREWKKNKPDGSLVEFCKQVASGKLKIEGEDEESYDTK